MHFGVHFPKENVQLCKNAVFFALQKTKMLCKNAFLHHILFCKNAFLHQQNVTNAFDALPKCILASNAFDAKMHFGVHFPKENVQQRCAKMHFCITFSKGKCSASHFPKENVQLCKNAFDAKMHLMRCKNAFLHQMHLMQKCI